MAKDFIPKKKSDFFEWTNNALMPYLSTKYQSWGIPSTAFIYDIFTIYNAHYTAAENPETRTPAAVKTFHNTKQLFVTELRRFLKAYITYNPLVTDEDRVNMRLPLHDKKPTPSTPPNTYPEVEIDSSVLRRLKINFHDSGSTSKAKPHGIHAAEIRWAILDTPPTDVKQIINSTVATRTPYTMTFSEQERGKSIYLCLRWETNRGETGPWSEIIRAIIP